MTKNEQIDFYCSFTQSKVQDCPIDEEVAKARAEVAIEIFAEIQKMCIDTFGNFNHTTFNKVKKKYTENENG